MKKYIVQIRVEDGYETHSSYATKASANRKARDLASGQHDGRIVTDKGTVVNEWELVRQLADEYADARYEDEGEAAYGREE